MHVCVCSAGVINVFCCDVVAEINVFCCDVVLKLMVPICVLCSEILFRCRNRTSCSELIFAADLCVVQRNSISLPKLSLLQRINIRCRFVYCAAEFCFAVATEPLAAKFYFAAETEPPTTN